MRKQANTHTKQLKDLEADARNEFFNFVKIELAHLKERGDVDDEVEIKDSYYDYIKPKVDELIANNRKYIKLDSQMPVNKLVIFMLLYCSISTVLAIIGLTTRFLSVAV